MKEFFVEAGGARIRAVECGSGPCVLLVHGNLASSLWYERVLPLPGCRAVALDMPNFGGSGPLPGEVSIDRYADAVAAFAEAAGLERPVLVGHSLGGGVATSLACRYPARWKALVLVDSAAPSGLQTPESRHPSIEAMRDNPAILAAVLRPVVPALGKGPEDEDFFARLVAEGSRMARHAWIGNAVALGRMDYAARCATYPGPVLALWGDRDVIVTRAMAAETAASFPRARLEVLEGIGHSPMVECPERFQALLAGFLASL